MIYSPVCNSSNKESMASMKQGRLFKLITNGKKEPEDKSYKITEWGEGGAQSMCSTEGSIAGLCSEQGICWHKVSEGNRSYVTQVLNGLIRYF